MLCARIREVLGSNLDWDTGYPERGLSLFPYHLQANAGALPLLGRDCFLPDTSQFIINLSYYHLTVYNLATDSVVK
jgi:hypothetical protein